MIAPKTKINEDTVITAGREECKVFPCEETLKERFKRAKEFYGKYEAEFEDI